MAFILRQLMDRGGDSDGSDEEEAALLEYEGGISTSEESEEEEGNENEEEGGEDGERGGEKQFDISLPAQHLVSNLPMTLLCSTRDADSVPSFCFLQYMYRELVNTLVHILTCDEKQFSATIY